MISTIIFDLSEVYLGGMLGIEEKISQIAPHFQVEDKLYRQKETQDFFNGKLTEDEFWSKLNEKYKWGIETTLLKKMVRSQMTEVSGTRQVLESLKKNGYKLGLLSIHAKEWVDHCEEKFDYHKLFHSKLYSFEVGVSKPAPKAFELILERLHTKADECLFIDDYEVSTAAANNLGILTILFENAEQLRNDLIHFGVKV